MWGRIPTHATLCILTHGMHFPSTSFATKNVDNLFAMDGMTIIKQDTWMVDEKRDYRKTIWRPISPRSGAMVAGTINAIMI